MVHSRQSRTYIETFLNYEDAEVWLSRHLQEFKENDEDHDWVIEQASINYINHQWRAGFVMSRKQGELFDVDPCQSARPNKAPGMIEAGNKV